MSELVSAYPTAGGIYWWAAKMGGPGWGWFTGWFNLIGLVAVTASVDYGASLFLNTTLGLYSVDWFNGTSANATTFLHGTFWLFLIILAFHAVVNIAGSHLVARINGVSVWWHVAGVLAILLVLVFVPAHHQSFKFVFTQRFNNSGFGMHMYWFYILPLGFLLTQYTITGYDASAHLSEETHAAAEKSAQGIWKSVAFCWVLGYVMLLAFTFAATHVEYMNGGQGNPYGAGSSIAVFASSLSVSLFKAVMIISVVGQFFCGGSALTAGSRVMYAFSRDRAVPGHRMWSKVNASHAPVNAALAVAVAGAIFTLPALYGNAAHIPVAFLALSAATTLSLYVAYVIPVYLRWRQRDEFVAGPWTLGRHYRWMCPVAVLEAVIVGIYFMLPFSPLGIPGHAGFAWDNGAINYAPVMMLILVGGAALWWVLSAHRWFVGPVPNVEDAPAAPALEPAPGD